MRDWWQNTMRRNMWHETHNSSTSVAGSTSLHFTKYDSILVIRNNRRLMIKKQVDDRFGDLFIFLDEHFFTSFDNYFWLVFVTSFVNYFWLVFVTSLGWSFWWLAQLGRDDQTDESHNLLEWVTKTGLSDEIMENLMKTLGKQKQDRSLKQQVQFQPWWLVNVMYT